ncbi:MAG: SCO family protein [Sphingomonadales bacterium]
MSKRGWVYLLFFVSLALVFYATLALVIPGYTKKGVAPVSYVRPFRFMTQDSNAFTQQDVQGKVYVASYFFTTCKGICPKMNNYLKEVYEALHANPDFLLLSHTCDPETDSVAQLKKYADSLAIDTKKWVFLTGRKDSLYYAARISYTIDDPANNLTSIEDDFLHTQFWALVDRNGDVKKIYDGLKESEVKQLIADAQKLLGEKN